MQPCEYCGLPTANVHGFCSWECYEGHYWDDMDASEDIDIGCCEDCGCNPCDCDSEPLGMSDVDADADTLRSCGWGTDEDYFYDADAEPW